MSWTIDRTRTPKRKKKDADAQALRTPARFDDYLTRKFQELQVEVDQERATVEASLRELQTEQERLEGQTSRGCLRQKKQVARQIQRLLEQKESLQRNMKLEEFKRRVLPYSEAYERELQILAMDHMRSTERPSSSVWAAEDDKASPGARAPSSEVMKDFLHEVENVPLKVVPNPNEICEECDDVMILEHRSSTLICPCCGNWKYYLDATSSHMAYGEEVEFTAFAYLRMNHFNERLTYSQAKESTRIADHDLQRIMDRLVERRITEVDKITPELTYFIAKELKMRHVYKQNTQLWCRITGKPPLRMTPEQEEQMRSMFRAVNRLWPKYKPEDRKNFLSYNYLLFKFCELLGMDQFCKLYKLLKGDKKLEKQDEIFKKVCDDPEINWEFIPSRHVE